MNVLFHLLFLLKSNHVTSYLLSAPTLIRESLDSNSLSLKTFVFDESDEYLTLETQRIFSSLKQSSWFQSSALKRQENDFYIWNVTDLLPYSKYRFRISLSNGTLSEASVIITTKPKGIPSPPILVSINQVDELHINISWLSPIIPKNKIVAYRLHIQQISNTMRSFSKDHPYEAFSDIRVKDSEEIGATYSHLSLQALAHNTMYNVTLKAVNILGQSGEIGFRVIHTSQAPAHEMSKIPGLLYTEATAVYLKDLRTARLYHVPEKIVVLDSPVTAICALEEKAWILDQKGNLFLLEDIFENKRRLTRIKTKEYYQDLSVDWLNERLYLLSINFIKHCHYKDLYKIEECTIMTSLSEKMKDVSHFDVDPYNGFLFWINDKKTLRMQVMEAKAEIHIIYEGHLHGAFTILSRKSRLLFPDGNRLIELYYGHPFNITVSVVHEDYRRRKPNFYDIQKIVSFQDTKLFWSSSEGLKMETYHSDHGYFVTLLESDVNITDLCLLEALPIPLPLNPITNLQVIFDVRSAKISWKMPRNPRGSKAWSNWSYEIQVVSKHQNLTISHLRQTNHELLNLSSNTLYTFTVRPYVGGPGGGNGVWSDPWSGKTLSSNVSLFWVTEYALYSGSFFENGILRWIPNITDVAIRTLNNELLFVQYENLYSYNIENESITSFSHISSVQSIVYEHYGDTLYFSTQTNLFALHLLSNQIRPLNISLIARNLIIDSYLARLCWISEYHGSSIQCSSLHGGNSVTTMFRIKQRWNDKIILSLSLDALSHNMYFFTYSEEYQEFELNRLGFLSNENYKVLLSRFQGDFPKSKIMMTYLPSNKLMWSSYKSLYIFDIEGNGMAEINTPIRAVTAIADISRFQKEYKLPLKVFDIRINGSLERYTISWKSNSHMIDYIVSIVYRDSILSLTTYHNYIHFNDSIYHDKMNVSIQARSKWAISNVTTAILTSPEGLPSSPYNVRCFRDSKRSKYMIRFNSPLFPNGQIRHYELYFNDNEPLNITQFTQKNKTIYINLFFDFDYSTIVIKASTGFGISKDFSPKIFIQPYLPQLVISTLQKGVFILDTDDLSLNHVPFLSREPLYQVSSIDENEFIYIIKNGILTHSKYWDHKSLAHNVSAFAFDSISNYIYFQHINDEKVYRLDLVHDKFIFYVNQITCSTNKMKIHHGVLYYLCHGQLYQWHQSLDCLPGNILDFDWLNDKLIVATKSNTILIIDPCQTTQYLFNETYEYFSIFETGLWTSLESKVKSSLKEVTDVQSLITSLTSINTPLKNTHCYKPKALTPLLVNSTTDSEITFIFPKIEIECGPYQNVPTTTYILQIRRVNHTFINVGNSLSSHWTIGNLTSYTNFTVVLWIQNPYGYWNQTLVASASTLSGVPSPPRFMTVIPLSPVSLQVSWTTPLTPNGPYLIYRIHYQIHHSVQVKVIGNSPLNQKNHSLILEHLTPESEYVLWIEALTSSKFVSSSHKMTVKTLSAPNEVLILSKTARSVNLSWKSPPESFIVSHVICLFPRKDPTVKISTVVTETQPSTTYSHELLHLWPGTEYIIKVTLSYRAPLTLERESNLTDFTWPLQDEFLTVTTIFDRPLVPGPPYVKEDTNGATVLTWNERDTNILYYELQALILYHMNQTNKWIVIYTDKFNIWPISALNESNYVFRVRAKNFIGWSDFSKESLNVNVAQIIARSKLSSNNSSSYATMMLGSLLGSALLCLMIFIFVIKVERKYRGLKKQSGPPLELVNLRQLPICHGVIDANNPLYQINGNNDNLSSIPKFDESQIIFKSKKILGCGAFGNVYEGLLRHNSRNINVAIKVLKEGATDVQKAEFLKEANVMAKFNHENILKLIGLVPNYNPLLLFELMEGGDLLYFLRSHRKSTTLSLENLILMSQDVAAGCVHLESNRHVHRDLAARNCLVSHSGQVKIGDFGMARNIYKQDYYRKDNGLMPVRWMAPESLVDALYTHQSDIWAFGVLLWEIFTLGKHPYPAMSNSDVLKYVKNGGHLEKPLFCPDSFYDLMQQCWAFEPQERPSFQSCYIIISKFLTSKEEMKCFSIASNTFSSKSSQDSWKLSNRSECTTLPLTNGYLELLQDNFSESLALESKVLESEIPVPFSSFSS